MYDIAVFSSLPQLANLDTRDTETQCNVHTHRQRRHLQRPSLDYLLANSTSSRPPPLLRGNTIKVPQLSRVPARQLAPFFLSIDRKEKEENNMYLKPSEVVRRAEGSSNQGVHGKTKQTPAENHMMHKRRAGYTALPPLPRSSQGPSHASWSTIIIQERDAYSSRPPREQRPRTRTMPHNRVKVTCSCR